MHYAAQPSSSAASAPRQNKVILQRQYREKEGECFNELREVINQLTGEELQTRNEILRKAIDLLLAARNMKEARVGHQNVTSAHIGHSTEHHPRAQVWQSTAGFNAQPVYYPSQTHGQQHPLTFNTSDQTGPAVYGENWPYSGY